MPRFNGPWVSLRSTHGYMSDHPHTGMHQPHRVYPVRVAYAAGRYATHFGVVNMWGMCRATGAPLVLPAVNDILPLSGQDQFSVFGCQRGGTRSDRQHTSCGMCRRDFPDRGYSMISRGLNAVIPPDSR